MKRDVVLFKMMDQHWKLFWVFHISLKSLALGKNGSCNSNGGCSYGLVCLNGECVECSDGWYGVNCSLPCPDGHFGKGCTTKCECQICDAVLGCVDISTLYEAKDDGSRTIDTNGVQTSSEGSTSTGTKSTNHPLEIHLLLIFGIVGLVIFCMAIVFGIVYGMHNKRVNNVDTVANESIQDVPGLNMDLQDMHGSVSANANQFVYESVYEEIREYNEEGEDNYCSDVYNVSSYSKDKARRVGVNPADGLYDATGSVAAHINRQMNNEQQIEGPYCLAKNVAPDHNTESD